MKKYHYFITCYLVLLIFGCDNITGDSSPGILGAVEVNYLNCSVNDVESNLSYLLTTDSFRVKEKDSTIVDYWKKGGFDFLNTYSLNINKRLYMLSLYSEDANETTLGIRAYYNRHKEKWIYAKKFNESEKSMAEIAMQKLQLEFSECE